jgi:thiamine-monophosphate kinase
MDLSRLCRESEVGAAVVLADVPVAHELFDLAEALAGAEPREMALSGGEDFELLATLPAAAVERTARRLRDRFGTPLTDVGEVRSQPGLVAVEDDGKERALQPRGWDHFAS